MMYVYIVRCSDGSYYTGVTNSLERRLQEHNSSLDRRVYTFKRRPVQLVFHQYFTNPSDAIRAEKQIKGWRREKKEALIEENYQLLMKLSKSRRATRN
jgi:putative endonuclease